MLWAACSSASVHAIHTQGFVRCAAQHTVLGGMADGSWPAHHSSWVATMRLEHAGSDKARRQALDTMGITPGMQLIAALHDAARMAGDRWLSKSCNGREFILSDSNVPVRLNHAEVLTSSACARACVYL